MNTLAENKSTIFRDTLRINKTDIIYLDSGSIIAITQRPALPVTLAKTSPLVRKTNNGPLVLGIRRKHLFL